MEYAVKESDIPTVPVAHSEAVFPVRRIFCVGKNYADHVKEMGGDPERGTPIFFSKPADAIVTHNRPVPYPPQTQNLHHEIELVIAIGREGTDISVSDAQDHIFGYGVGIDLTRRDLQAAAKAKGHPWDTAKGFDHSAPISALHRVEDMGHPQSGTIWLTVNGKERQNGDISDMIWSIPEVVATLSSFYTLKPGDLIFTGTPAGVGAIGPCDLVEGGIEGIDTITTLIE